MPLTLSLMQWPRGERERETERARNQRVKLKAADLHYKSSSKPFTVQLFPFASIHLAANNMHKHARTHETFTHITHACRSEPKRAHEKGDKKQNNATIRITHREHQPKRWTIRFAAYIHTLGPTTHAHVCRSWPNSTRRGRSVRDANMWGLLFDERSGSQRRRRGHRACTESPRGEG